MTDHSKRTATDLSTLSVKELESREAQVRGVMYASIGFDIFLIAAGVYLYLSPTMRISSIPPSLFVPLLFPTFGIAWCASRLNALRAERQRRSS